MSDGSFFAGYAQREVLIRGVRGKVPLFYPRLSFAAAVFSADLTAIRAVLPDTRQRPIRIAPGRGLAALHCLEYQQSDVGPYNEVSLSFPIQYGESRLPGPAALLGSVLLNHYHAYVQALPVTTQVAVDGGVDFFNFPKYLADITFHEIATHRVCTLRDQDTKDLIAEFSFRRRPLREGPRAMVLNTYPTKDGQPLHARVRMNLLQYAIDYGRDFATLTHTEHPRATIFGQLKLGRPLMTFYVPRAQGILFPPEALAGPA